MKQKNIPSTFPLSPTILKPCSRYKRVTAALPVGLRIVVYSEEKLIHEKAAVIILSISFIKKNRVCEPRKGIKKARASVPSETVAPQRRYNYDRFPWAKVGKSSDTTKQLDGNITAK